MSDEFDSFKKPDEESELINALWAGMEMPSGWEEINIKEHVDVVTGNSFSSERFGETGVPLIKNKTVKHQAPEVYVDSEFKDKYLVEEGSLLVTMDGEFVPRIWKLGDAALNQRVCKLVPDNHLDKLYLRYSLQYPLMYVQCATAGTTVKHLSSKDFDNIDLPVPPLSEQERIASVLYSVDEHVRVLDERHSRLKDLKHGLMQDLLTGNYRTKGGKVNSRILDFSPDEETEVESSEGKLENGPFTQEVPGDWGSTRLGEVCELQTGHNYNGDLYLEEEEANSVPFVTLKSIAKGGGYKQDGIKYYDRTDVDDKYILRRGDIVIANTDVTQEGEVMGMPAQIPIDYNREYAYSMDLTKLEGIGEYYNTVFLNYLLRLNHIKKRMKSMAAGTTVLHIQTAILPTLEIPYPPIAEQERIASVLYTVDEMITRTSELRARYERLKRGLMQDLLSGDVRTPDTLEPLQEITRNNGRN